MRINPKLKEDLRKYLTEKMKGDREKVVVFSSIKLSDFEKKLIKSKFSTISFQKAEYRIDENLIAGIIITVGSRVIDLSLKGSLTNLKHIIYESN